MALVTLMVGCAACASEDAPEPAEPIPPQSGSFEALTYNVAGLPQGISGSDPEANMPLISPLLNSYDLVLVQEDFSYHDALVAELTHPYQSTPKEPDAKFVADGLNRFSVIPWTDFARVPWAACFGDATSGASDCLAEKGFSFARTELGDRVTVDVYNLHAEAGGGSEDVAAREIGIDQLIADVLARSEGRAVIIGGDTNLHRDDPEDLVLIDRIIDELDVIDACLALDCGEDHIDRFFLRSSDLVDVTPTAWRVADEFVDESGNDLSDHPAIHITVAWSTR